MTDYGERELTEKAGSMSYAWNNADSLGHALWRSHGKMVRPTGLGERFAGHLSLSISRPQLAPFRGTLEAGSFGRSSALTLALSAQPHPLVQRSSTHSMSSKPWHNVQVGPEGTHAVAISTIAQRAATSETPAGIPSGRQFADMEPVAHAMNADGAGAHALRTNPGTTIGSALSTESSRQILRAEAGGEAGISQREPLAKRGLIEQSNSKPSSPVEGRQATGKSPDMLTIAPPSADFRTPPFTTPSKAYVGYDSVENPSAANFSRLAPMLAFAEEDLPQSLPSESLPSRSAEPGSLTGMAAGQRRISISAPITLLESREPAVNPGRQSLSRAGKSKGLPATQAAAIATGQAPPSIPVFPRMAVAFVAPRLMRQIPSSETPAASMGLESLLRPMTKATRWIETGRSSSTVKSDRRGSPVGRVSSSKSEESIQTAPNEARLDHRSATLWTGPGVGSRLGSPSPSVPGPGRPSNDLSTAWDPVLAAFIPVRTQEQTSHDLLGSSVVHAEIREQSPPKMEAALGGKAGYGIPIFSDHHLRNSSPTILTRQSVLPAVRLGFPLPDTDVGHSPSPRSSLSVNRIQTRRQTGRMPPNSEAHAAGYDYPAPIRNSATESSRLNFISGSPIPDGSSRHNLPASSNFRREATGSGMTVCNRIRWPENSREKLFEGMSPHRYPWKGETEFRDLIHSPSRGFVQRVSRSGLVSTQVISSVHDRLDTGDSQFARKPNFIWSQGAGIQAIQDAGEFPVGHVQINPAQYFTTFVQVEAVEAHPSTALGRAGFKDQVNRNVFLPEAGIGQSSGSGMPVPTPAYGPPLVASVGLRLNSGARLQHAHFSHSKVPDFDFARYPGTMQAMTYPAVGTRMGQARGIQLKLEGGGKSGGLRDSAAMNRALKQGISLFPTGSSGAPPSAKVPAKPLPIALATNFSGARGSWAGESPPNQGGLISRKGAHPILQSALAKIPDAADGIPSPQGDSMLLRSGGNAEPVSPSAVASQGASADRINDAITNHPASQSDLEDVVDQVWRRLSRKLKAEQERRGLMR